VTSPAIPFALPARRIPWGFLGALAALTALGWGLSLRVAGAGHHGLPLWARVVMWTTMMVGMMVPPEVPTLLRLAADARSERWRAVRGASALLGGYLGVWVLASAALAGVDAWLSGRGLMSHEMASRSVPLSVAILVAAGLVQLSPWKTACLARCRAIPAELGMLPPGKVSNTFAGGAAHPFRSGFRHGFASVSSCGVLMLVLLVVGAMNWLAMVALTGYLIVERLVPARAAPVLGRVTGLGLLLWGGWLTLGTVVG
jgi:predicted metal-binding membrane protein